jgi:hypothetical protein
MAKKILSSSEDSCGCEGTGLGIQGSVDPIDQIIVRHQPGTEVGNFITELRENGKKVYELSDFTLQFPIVALTNNAPVLEVGDTLEEVEFSGSILQGTYPIATRSLDPDEGVILTAPFTFVKTNVKRTTAGTAELHTLSATDDQGNVKNVSKGVSVKQAMYQGFNNLASLTQAEIKALANKVLKDSVVQEYAGAKTYVVPGGDPKYIYWCGPVGTTAISGATLSGLPLLLTDLAPVLVTNVHDNSIQTSYWVKRTSVKFNPGSYVITIS